MLLKGGHLGGHASPDILACATDTLWLSGPRHDTKNTHGTGCSLSAGIAAELAKGAALREAVATAKEWLSGAIAAADRLDIGGGHGPVDHFHHLFP